MDATSIHEKSSKNFAPTKMTARRRLAAISLLTILAGIFLLYLMHADIWHDESMYMSAGVLVQDHMLYRDFSYLQMPILPYLYAIIFRLTQSPYLLLCMKLFNWIAVVTTLAVFYRIVEHLTHSAFYAGAASICLAFNSIFLHSTKYMANAVLPLPFALLAILFYLRAIDTTSRRASWWTACSGAMIGIAVGIKSYYIAAVPAMAFAALFAPPQLPPAQRLKTRFLPFCLACGAALLPVAYFFFSAPEAFTLNNFGYHITNSNFKEIEGYQRAMTFGGKVDFIWNFLQFAPNLGIILAIGFSAWCLRLDRNSWEWQSWRNQLFIPLIALTTAAAVVLKPLWLHYFVLPLPFVMIYAATFYPRLLPRSQKLVRVLVAMLAVFQTLLSGHYYYDRIPENIGKPWQPLAFHEMAQKIADQIGPLSSCDRVATLSPHVALEARLPIYPEFATGIFLYRLAHTLAPAEQQIYITTSKETAEQFFAADPPKAFLVGKFITQEAPWIRFATSRGYRCITTDLQGLTLYVRPDTDGATAPAMPTANAIVCHRWW
jgi:hypothetical protein